jgi:hypothetical protein
MAVISQGRRQWIVSTQTLLTWKRFGREHESAEVVEQGDDGALIVDSESGLRRILGNRVEELA